MKLYVFKVTSWSKPPELKMEEFEVEEKPKTYICKSKRFNKKDIGHVTGYEFDECMLLENNPSKACEILLKIKENELKWAEEKVMDKKSEIEMLRSYIRREVGEQEFCESKNASQQNERPQAMPQTDSDGFMNIPDGIDDELPFN